MAPTKEKDNKDKDKDNKPDEGMQDEGMQDGPPETNPPTTEAPTTPKPTKAPTSAPTLSPTKAPTEYPTWPPTEAPSPEPTRAPSPDPTPGPTMAPSEEAAAASEPTEAISNEEPTEGALVQVRMASMNMDILTDGEKVDGEKLEMDMEYLLNDEILDRVYDSFSHVDLNVMLISTNNTRRQLQAGSYEADIEGTAFFLASNDIPTSEQLEDFLYTYFSIYDSDDLKGALSEENPAIVTAEIRSVGGEAVDIQSLNKGTTEGSPESSSVPLGALVGLVLGAVGLLAAIGALVWLKSKEDKDRKKGSVSSPAERTTSAGPHDEIDSIDVEDELSIGISSIGESIYTQSSNVFVKNPVPRNTASPPEQYNSNQLESIVNAANAPLRQDSEISQTVYDYGDKDSYFEDVYSENSGDAPPQIQNPVSF